VPLPTLRRKMTDATVNVLQPTAARARGGHQVVTGGRRDRGAALLDRLVTPWIAARRGRAGCHWHAE